MVGSLPNQLGWEDYEKTIPLKKHCLEKKVHFYKDAHSYNCYVARNAKKTNGHQETEERHREVAQTGCANFTEVRLAKVTTDRGFGFLGEFLLSALIQR